MKINIINYSNNYLPEYKTLGSSGMDLQAFLKKNIILKPFERKLIPTGISIELPFEYEGQIRSRSGLSLKYGIICLNSPGTIDSDYRGSINIILINISSKEFIIKNGDRIAQIIFSKYKKIKWKIAKKLNKSIRGIKGFGSTGINDKKKY